MTADASQPTHFYLRAWRWHFYAGLFVAPFLCLLAVTGIVYLYKPQLDRLLYPELLIVAPAHHHLPADQLLAVARAHYPEARVSKYLPAVADDRSVEVVLDDQGVERSQFVDPYTGRWLGEQETASTLQGVARGLHAELLMGKVGDWILEVVAGWGLLLLVSGLYLWWPRTGAGVNGVMVPRRSLKRRRGWRDLHAATGFWAATGLLFFLLSGMTWTGFWGGQFADVWNRFPASMWNQVPESAPLARQLNQPHQQTVPWALENTPLPESGAHHTHTTSPTLSHQGQIALQQIVELAESRGVAPGYSISLPQGERGVYTVSLFADDPRHDATLHMDQYSGAVLADVRWQDYSAVAKAVETGVMLHMGKMYGPLHQLVMLVLCLLILLLSLSGLWLWWQRRPARRFGVPPLPHSLSLWRGALVISAVLGLLFPLLGGTLLLVWLLDSAWLRWRGCSSRRAVTS